MFRTYTCILCWVNIQNILERTSRILYPFLSLISNNVHFVKVLNLYIKRSPFIYCLSRCFQPWAVASSLTLPRPPPSFPEIHRTWPKPVTNVSLVTGSNGVRGTLLLSAHKMAAGLLSQMTALVNCHRELLRQHMFFLIELRYTKGCRDNVLPTRDLPVCCIVLPLIYFC